jgi:hypothetical protein
MFVDAPGPKAVVSHESVVPVAANADLPFVKNNNDDATAMFRM